VTSAPAVRPGRTILGISAVLLPFTADGDVDRRSFEALLADTVSAGLIPAVNMDTGYVQLLDTRACSSAQPARADPPDSWLVRSSATERALRSPSTRISTRWKR
jgi:hypothetical protein